MARRDLITGTWRANSNNGDLLISYSGININCLYEYQTVGSKAAKAFFAEDINNNGRYDSGEPIMGSWLAKTSFVRDFLPVISSGRFTANANTGRFSLFHGSTAFATGLIFDQSYYF